MFEFVPCDFHTMLDLVDLIITLSTLLWNVCSMPVCIGFKSPLYKSVNLLKLHSVYVSCYLPQSNELFHFHLDWIHERKCRQGRYWKSDSIKTLKRIDSAHPSLSMIYSWFVMTGTSWIYEHIDNGNAGLGRFARL